MMVRLLSGGINLSIIATANLCALAMAWVLTAHATGGEGAMWGLAGDCSAGGRRGRDNRRADQWIRDRLS